MASKTNGAHSMEHDWARAPPQAGSFCEKLGKIIYDPEEKSIFGRTPKRWGIVLIFYGIFYAVLAAMFAACMAGLYHVIEEDRPHFTLDQSLIGINPGVSYRPLPENGFILNYFTSNMTESHPIIEQLNEFFQGYKKEKWYADYKECKVEDKYGYPDTPCFFIKVNKIFDWQPDFYTASDLPADMSEDLKQHISGLSADQQKQVWVSCWDEHGNATSFEYPWGRGIASSFYPYVNEKGYKSPVLAVKFTPEVGSLQTVRCRAWAKNIIYNKSIKEATGYARIQYQITDDNAESTTATNV